MLLFFNYYYLLQTFAPFLCGGPSLVVVPSSVGVGDVIKIVMVMLFFNSNKYKNCKW